MSTDPRIALIRELIEESKREHERILNEALFKSEPYTGPPVTPTPRWKKVYWRVREYLVTLWWALKGENPYECEHDY